MNETMSGIFEQFECNQFQPALPQHNGQMFFCIDCNGKRQLNEVYR